MGEQIAEAVAPIGQVLLPIALGLLLRTTGLFGEGEGALLRRFVVRFTVPLFVFFSAYEAAPDSLASIVPMSAAFMGMTALLFAVGWLAANRFAGAARRSAVHACVTFGNYGWMGLGVAQALFGDGGSQRVVYFILPWWPAFYGFGLAIGLIHVGRHRGGVPLRRTAAIAVPPIAALLLGLALNTGGVAVPALAREVLTPFSDMTVPLILLSVGLLLDVRRLRRNMGAGVAVSAVTLLAGPLVGWALAAVLAREALTRAVIVLEGAMPVATLVPVLEENYAMDKDLVGTAIVLSTLLSLLTIPAVGVLLGA
jgi:hypothetical protein